MRYVIDANVIFDFRDGGLLSELGELPDHEFMIIDAVWHGEIDGDTRDACPNLNVLNSSPDELAEASRIRANNRGLSFNDCRSIVACKIHDAILTTGDGHMRTMAQDLKVRITGSIGLLDDLLACQIIGHDQACRAIDKMEETDRRLPPKIISQRREEWGC